jgi:hypothetical protein
MATELIDGLISGVLDAATFVPVLVVIIDPRQATAEGLRRM